MKPVSEIIKSRRKELKYTQEHLAELTGYNDRSSIAKIESGKVDIPESKIKVFSKALNISPVYLLGLTDDKHYTINGDNNIVNTGNNAKTYAGEGNSFTITNTTLEDSNPSHGNIEESIALQETNEQVQADMLTLLQEILKVNQENLRVQKEILETIKKAH